MDKPAPRYYFAYGSNLSVFQMKYHCPSAQVVGSTILSGYRLSFNGVKPNRGYLTVEKCDGSVVPIGIYTISEQDESRLDVYEGYPTLYKKEYLTLPFNDTEITGLIYIMRPIFPNNVPANNYYFICIDGYNNFNFDRELLQAALNRAKEEQEKRLSKIPQPKKDVNIL